MMMEQNDLIGTFCIVNLIDVELRGEHSSDLIGTFCIVNSNIQEIIS